jgi:hypothetical protein
VHPCLYALLGKLGIVQPEVISLMVPDFMPRVSWWTDFAEAHWGWPEEVGLEVFFWALMGSITCLTVGLFSRTSAVVSWVLHLAYISSGAAAAYGVSQFSALLLFFLICTPLGQVWSVDAWLRPGLRCGLSACVCQRVLRWQLCLIYVSSGVEKSVGEQWHNGEAIWRAGITHEHERLLWLAEVPWLAVGICWGTLLLEAGYVLCWWPPLRRWWILGIISMHLGIAVFIGLWHFSLTMILFNAVAWWEQTYPVQRTGEGWED